MPSVLLELRTPFGGTNWMRRLGMKIIVGGFARWSGRVVKEFSGHTNTANSARHALATNSPAVANGGLQKTRSPAHERREASCLAVQ